MPMMMRKYSHRFRLLVRKFECNYSGMFAQVIQQPLCTLIAVMKRKKKV